MTKQQKVAEIKKILDKSCKTKFEKIEILTLLNKIYLN